MSKIIKNILIGIMIIILVLLFVFHYALNSEKVMRDAIVNFVHSRYADIEVTSLTLGKVKFIYPANVSFGKVDCQFKIKGQVGSFFLEHGNIFLKDVFDSEMKNVFVDTDGLNVRFLEVKLNNLNLFANALIPKRDKPTFTSEVDLGSLEVKDYRMSSISFDMDLSSDKMVMDDFTAHFYGGDLSGKIEVLDNRVYDCTAHLDIQEVDLYALEESNPDIFSYVRAKVNGKLTVAGNKDGMTSLDFSMEAIDGAMMKATLLKQLLSLVSASLGKDIATMLKTDNNVPLQEALDDLIQVDGSVPLNHIVLTSKSQSNDKVNTFISFESDPFNLNIDSLTIDTKVEGGYQSLLRFL